MVAHNHSPTLSVMWQRIVMGIALWWFICVCIANCERQRDADSHTNPNHPEPPYSRLLWNGFKEQIKEPTPNGAVYYWSLPVQG